MAKCTRVYDRSVHGWQLLLLILSLSIGGLVIAATSRLQLENELLLELRLDGQSMGMDILGYQRADEFLLSLGELSSGLGFPISVDAVQGTANGWFIEDNRTFSLDLQSSEVISDGRTFSISDGDVIAFEGDLYVESNALQAWFPVRLNPIIRQLYLEVETLEPLPIQKRYQLEDRYLTTSTGPNLPRHRLQENPYQLLGPHITRARFALSTVREDFEQSADYQSNHALLSRGDLGWMTSTFSLAGQSDETVTAARLKLERSALDAPLGLNHIEIGDVDTGGYRGLLLSSLDRSSSVSGRVDTDSITLEGNQLPDWDVELYQNGQLIMFQTVGEDGRYLFEEIPLLFGENRFELKFFGPFGEIETREEFHFLGIGMLDPGKVSYELSAVQSGRTLFGINDVEGDGDRDSITYSGNFNLGLTRNLTTGASIKSIERNGQREDSSSFSLGLTTSRFYGSLNYVEPATSQSSLGASIRTQFGQSKLGLGYTSFIDDPDLENNTQKWQGNFDLTSSIRNLPLKLEITANQQENSRLFDTVIGTTLPLAGSGRFSSSIWHTTYEERVEEHDNDTSLSGGHSSFHTIMRPWAFRLSSNYSFAPESELLDLSFESNLRIERDLTLDLRLRQDTVTDKTYYGAGINWLLNPVSINAQITFDSDERWTGLLTFSTSLIHAPGTSMPRFDSRTSVDSGVVEARIFENLDDTEMKPRAGIAVNAVQAWKRAVSDDDGVAYLSRMPAHQQVDIEVDDSTVVEGELRSANPGVSVIARPGSYTVVEFPLIRTAELEGHVYVLEGETEVPVSRALVTLTSPDGTIVAQRRTAFDGFYLFDGIKPGTYEISMEDQFSGRLLKQPEHVTLTSSDPLLQNQDFALLPVKANMIPGTTFAAVETPPGGEKSSNVSDNNGMPQLSEVETLESIEPKIAAAHEKSPAAQLDALPVDQGNWFVQLGAYASADVARGYWEELKAQSELLSGKSAKLESFNNMTRLLVAPGMSRETAQSLCQSLKSERIDCMLRDAGE